MLEAGVPSASSRSILVIAEASSAGDDTAYAAELTGARLFPRVSIADAVDRLGQMVALPDTLAVDLQGTDVTLADDLLSRVDSLVRENVLGAVVSLDPEQIDGVTAHILGRHIPLLCGPSIAERVSALSIAGLPRHSEAHESARDERERLQMLNDEVARIAETLARLTRNEERRSAGLSEPPLAFDTGADLQPVKAQAVRNAIRARRMRNSFFRNDLFADPAWDMLLDLYAAHLEHARVSVSSLCIAAAVPGTTALRWIGTMLEERIFQRTADPVDRRRAYISLTESAQDGMHRYFDAVQRAGLASA